MKTHNYISYSHTPKPNKTSTNRVWGAVRIRKGERLYLAWQLKDIALDFLSFVLSLPSDDRETC